MLSNLIFFELWPPLNRSRILWLKNNFRLETSVINGAPMTANWPTGIVHTLSELCSVYFSLACYSPEITSFELGKLYHSLFCPHFQIQTVAGKLREGRGRRSWDSRAMMIFKCWKEKDKMWSRVGGVDISKFDRYCFWTVIINRIAH